MRAETTYKRFANPSVSFADTSPVRGGKKGKQKNKKTAILYIIRVRVREFLRTC